jgi:hypothetical protein
MATYTHFFGPDNQYWSPNAENNRMFLLAQQGYANDRLRGVGHVFLNEVYDMLGFQRTRAGAQVGWVQSHENSYISFGINLLEESDSFQLTFNVHGPIIDALPEE